MNKKCSIIIFCILIIFAIFNITFIVKSSYYYNIEGFAFEPLGIDNDELEVSNLSINIEVFEEGTQSNLNYSEKKNNNVLGNDLFTRVESTYQIFNKGVNLSSELILPIWASSNSDFNYDLYVNGMQKEPEGIKYSEETSYLDLTFVNYTDLYNDAYASDFSFEESLKGKLFTFNSSGDNDYSVSITYNKGNRKLFFDYTLQYQYSSNQENITIEFKEKSFEIFVIGGDITIDTNDDTSINQEEITYNEYLDDILIDYDIDYQMNFGLIAKKFYELITSYNSYGFFGISDLIQCYDEYRIIFLEYDIEFVGDANNEIILTQTVPFYYSDWWNGNNSQFHFNYIIEPLNSWTKINSFNLEIQTSIANSVIECNDIILDDGQYESSDIKNENIKQIHFFVQLENNHDETAPIFETDDPVFVVLILMTIILIPLSIFIGGIVFIVIIVIRSNKKKNIH